jgi:hypothetical protein
MAHKSRQDILDKLHIERRYRYDKDRDNGTYKTPVGQYNSLARIARGKGVPFKLSYENYLTVIFSSCPNGHPGSAMNSLRLIDQDFGGYYPANVTQVCSQCLTKEKNNGIITSEA